jgi:hypothetical protein
MQSRQYRAGDALDDYCPRERRVTEHAVVALVEGTVERTRCVACDVEHEYRHGRAPARRTKAPATAALYAEVLESIEVPAGRSPAAPSRPAPPAAQTAENSEASSAAVAHSAPATAASAPRIGSPSPAVPLAAAAPAPETASPAPRSETVVADADADDRPFRRTLLRAQLPRHEGQVATTRAIPEFTMHQPPPPRGQRHRRFGGRPGPGFEGPMRSSRDGGHPHGRGPVPPQGNAASGDGHSPAGGHGRRRRRRRKKPPTQG